MGRLEDPLEGLTENQKATLLKVMDDAIAADSTVARFTLNQVNDLAGRQEYVSVPRVCHDRGNDYVVTVEVRVPYYLPIWTEVHAVAEQLRADDAEDVAEQRLRQRAASDIIAALLRPD